MKNVICDYCGEKTQLVAGKEIYLHRPDLYKKNFYICKPCDAYVGCHRNTTKPLGRLANKELRRAKNNAHVVFDPLWKSKKMSRHSAYKWLAEKLQIEPRKCHIGMFDVEMCKRVISVLTSSAP